MEKAPVGVGWGTTNTPVKDRIDVSKQYRTKSGHKVIGLQIVLENSCGREVTYPVKGSIIIPGRRPRYAIWSLDGKSDVVWGERSKDDLVEYS